MKSLILFFIAITLVNNLTSQDLPVLENYPLKEVDLVVFPFGMEYPIKIGSVTDSGELVFNSSMSIPAEIPKETLDLFWGDLTQAMHFKCDSGLGMEDLKTINAGQIVLWTHEGRYAGILFALGNEEMLPWVENSLSNMPVAGSFYELILVQTDLDIIYDASCQSTLSLESGEDLISNYSFILDLGNGFNLIKYTIEELSSYEHTGVYNPDIMETTVIPRAVSITSSNLNGSDIKWFAKYF